MSRQSLSIVLAERPEGAIVPGKTFRQQIEPAPKAEDLKDGEVLVEALYLSLDPATRHWLNEDTTYLPPMQIGEVMRGWTIARVLASRSPRASAGDIVTSGTGWREVAIVGPEDFETTGDVPLPENGRVTDLMGVLGMTGLTGYFGMTRIGQPGPGDTVVVSGAAGATGSVAAQIAKIAGARVVGLAGSDRKCEWLAGGLGLDLALNYKDADFERKLVEATPNLIDVYFDNVGGDILDLALSRANKNARFVMCGTISQYNSTVQRGLKDVSNIIGQRVRMEGFLIFDYADEHLSARKQLAQWLAEGKLKRQDTIVKGGLQVADKAFLDLFHGGNTGKLLVEVKSPGAPGGPDRVGA